MLAYAKPMGDDIYSFDLTAAQTSSVIMGNGNTMQEDNAIFFQAMCVLHGDKYQSPTEDEDIYDLSDVLLYLDFAGIFDKNADNPKVGLKQKKTESMFRPEGITLDFGHGAMKFLAFERSGSMSRNAKLSFVRADVYDELRRRMMVGMNIGNCQLSKLYAYNGLLFSSGTRIESNMLWDKDSIVVIDNPTAVYHDIDIITVEDTTGEGDIRTYERVEKKTDIKVTMFDGEGLISPELAEEIDILYCGKHTHSSFQIRMPYIKGMVHEVDFGGFLNDAEVNTITDMWGVSHPAEKVKMILTKSQFKGCGWMSANGLSFGEYLERCRNYRHTLYITGVNNAKNELYTELNYQFLSTLSLDADSFRPKDIPFGTLGDDSRTWLTKTTEEVYYKLLNNEFFQFDYYVDHTPKNKNSRRYRLTDMLYRNDLLLREKIYKNEIERAAETLIQNFAKGNILVSGTVAYLSSDIALMLAELLKLHLDRGKPASVYRKLLSTHQRYTTAYGVINKAALLRNPHIAKNEEAIVHAPKSLDELRDRYLSHLDGVVMVEPQSLIAERLGGADYDGDMVKVIYDPVIIESIETHYSEPKTPFEDKYSTKNNLPLLIIPTAEPQIRDADDWYARFETVRSTFSSRVGQISNAALDRSMFAYDESINEETKELNRKETETLAILTGLEIDSAKSGVKPDLSAYLDNKTAKRSHYLKYKRLLDDAESRPAWYETTFAEKMKKYIESTDWESITANVEKLPYYAYVLKKHTPRTEFKPAPASELFSFAKHPKWEEALDPDLFAPIKELIDTYDRCLRRIRSSSHPTPNNSKKKDIDRILVMRDQEDRYNSENLYALFSEIDATRIKTIRDSMKAEKWHFMKMNDRLDFLGEYLPEEGFREYDLFFSNFRMGGYRVLGDIICDIDDDFKNADRSTLHYKNDGEAMTAMIDAYIERKPGTDYREAIATATLTELAKIVSPFMGIRYAEALGRRDFILDVMLEIADHYLIGGNNG